MTISVRGFRRLTPELRKLALSLGSNVLTRVPGAVGVIFFLPRLRFGLGVELFGQTLAALSAGTIAALLFGGIGTLSRRTIGESYARADEAGQADAFRTIVQGSLVVLMPSALVLAAYVWWNGSSGSILIVALLAMLTGYANIFDNVRAAYNEHYVTAFIQFILQIIFYALGFTFIVFRRDPVLGAVVMQAPSILASVFGLVPLLMKRRYLLHGKPRPVRPMLSQSIVVALADGYLVSTLNLAVVLIQMTEPANTSAWFAATVRVFQTFLVPVTLLVLPLASYIRILWSDKDERQRNVILQTTIGASMIYGVLVAIGMFVAMHFYVEAQMHLSRPGSAWLLLPVLALFAAIVIYRSFSLIAYMVLDVAYLSRISMIGLLIASAAALAVGALAGGLVGVAAYGAAGSFALVTVLITSVRHYSRSTTAVPKPSW